MKNGDYLEVLYKALDSTMKENPEVGEDAVRAIFTNGDCSMLKDDETRKALEEINLRDMRKALISGFVEELMDNRGKRWKANPVELAIINATGRNKEDARRLIAEVLNGEKELYRYESTPENPVDKQIIDSIAKRISTISKNREWGPIEKIVTPITNEHFFDSIEKVGALVVGSDTKLELSSGEGLHITGTIGHGLSVASVTGKDADGNTRLQEDAALIIYNPKNPKFKMMVVAEGHSFKGYPGQGQVASNTIVKEFEKWFEGLDPSLYEGGSDIYNLWDAKIKEIDRLVREKTKFGGCASFCGAIVRKEDTIIGSIGNARAYAFTKEGKIEQITVDDTSTYGDYYHELWEVSKEETRFSKTSEDIQNSIGVKFKQLDYKRVNNKGVRSVILATGGGCQLIADEDIKLICRDTDPAKLAESLAKATQETSYIRAQRPEDNGMFKGETKAGRRNATFATNDYYAPEDK